MGFRFRRSVKITPGIRLNFNKKSTSITMGTRGVHHTINSSGTKTTSVGLPGSGLSYTTRINPKQSSLDLNTTTLTLSEHLENKCSFYKKLSTYFISATIVFALMSFIWLWCAPLAIGALAIYFILIYAYYDIYTKEATKIIETKKKQKLQ